MTVLFNCPTRRNRAHRKPLACSGSAFRYLERVVMTCIACERIEKIRKQQNPFFITELSESFVVLADEQRYEGIYCMLLLKTHEEYLEQLSAQRQLMLFGDVIKVANAITRSFKPERLNYECLGKQSLAHIHWHIIPRYKRGPEPGQPIWVRQEEERRTSVSSDRLQSLIENLRSKIER